MGKGKSASTCQSEHKMSMSVRHGLTCSGEAPPNCVGDEREGRFWRNWFKFRWDAPKEVLRWARAMPAGVARPLSDDDQKNQPSFEFMSRVFPQTAVISCPRPGKKSNWSTFPGGRRRGQGKPRRPDKGK